MKRQIQPKQLRSSDSSLQDDVFDLKYIPFIKLDFMSDQQLPKFVGERNLLMVLLLVLNVFLDLFYLRNANGKRAEPSLPCKYCVGLERLIAPF